MVDRLPSIDPRHAVLLVMDYQRAWLNTLADPGTVLARAAQALAIARERGALVTYVRVAFTQADYTAVPAANLIFTGLTSRPGALDADAPAMAIDDRVAPQPGD